MLKTFLSVLKAFFFLALVGSLTVLSVFYYFGQELPDFGMLESYEPPVVSRLYASDGRMFAEYALEKRVFVPFNAIPRRIVRTFLSAEDKNFYSHPGIDAMGIIRAVLTNIMNYGSQKPLIGASTITQQVAKNFFVGSERSIARKVKEAILAFRIENALTKDRILELYLNEIYLGRGSYGIAAAALCYFNKALDELSTEEAAYLAALPKGPNNYDPQRNYAAATRRRNWVIGRMYEDGVISKEEAETSLSRPLALRQPDEAQVVHADFFAEEVRRELMARYGGESLYKGGLVVRTSLSPHYQKAADSALRKGLIEYDRRHGWRGPIHKIAPQATTPEWVETLKTVLPPKGLDPWVLAVVTQVSDKTATIILADGVTGTIPFDLLKWGRKRLPEERVGPPVKMASEVLSVGDVVAVSKVDEKNHYELCQIPAINGAVLVMDPHSGQILAVSGGYSYQMSEFNRATQAMRQTGSTFKLFAYLSALEAGWTPNSVIVDEPIHFSTGSNQTWSPKNITHQFYGPVTLRVAFEKSLNISSIRLSYSVGIQRLAEIVQRLGVIDDMPHQLAQVLGAGSSTLKKMVTAISTVLNGGHKINPSFIDRIQDRRGTTLYRHDQRSCLTCQNQIWPDVELPVLVDSRPQIVNPIHAYQMVSMLEGVVQRGSAQRAKVLNRPVGGKTGSTNGFCDGWFIGVTPDLVVGVFVGFDSPRTMGPHEAGSRVALPIFVHFVQDALEKTPKMPFRVPPGVKLIRTNIDTGFPASPQDKRGIWEAMEPGSVPKYLGPGTYKVRPLFGNQDNSPTAETETVKKPPVLAPGAGQIY